MTKFLAAAHDPDSLSARRARLNSESTDGARADSREEPKKKAADPALDADMLDFVNRFEENFSALAPARDEPQIGDLSDDLFPPFPDESFEIPPARSRPRTLELARFE